MQWFHDPQRQISVYPRSDVLLTAIPEARTINGSLVAVPHTLRNAQVLRHFSYPVAPIITDQNYDWPAPPGVKPYESQKIAANFMALHPRCFNLSDMGSGKTFAALWTCDWLMRHHPPGTFRVLIVCPLSIMETVWVKAIFGNFLSHRRTEILYGSAERRLTKLRSNADFFVVNFDGIGVGARTGKGIVLDGFSKALAERSDIRMVIVDEASAYKDAQTKRHRIARMVIGRRDHLILMTGTPTPNRPSDAYGLTKMVNNAWGKSFTTFRSECEVQVSPYIWKPRADGYQYARKFLSPSIRFDIQDIWDGPELTTQQREIDLTTQQKKLMAELKRDLQIEIKTGQQISALNEASARLKFIQISLGAVYDKDHQAHRVDAAPRLEELKAVIREAPAKLLIFVPLTSVVNLLYKELTTKFDAHGKAKEHWSAEIINGETHPKDRSRIFQAFQNETDPRILIADPAAMAHGLDLWAARTVVWYAPIDKTELYLQANKRAHRPGQKFPVTIVQLASNQLEKEIFRRLDHNETMQGVLLDMIKKGEL